MAEECPNLRLRKEWQRQERIKAAAPDLLAACEFALDRLENMTTGEFSSGGDKEARELLAAAIAKATGEERNP